MLVYFIQHAQLRNVIYLFLLFIVSTGTQAALGPLMCFFAVRNKSAGHSSRPQSPSPSFNFSLVFREVWLHPGFQNITAWILCHHHGYTSQPFNLKRRSYKSQNPWFFLKPLGFYLNRHSTAKVINVLLLLNIFLLLFYILLNMLLPIRKSIIFSIQLLFLPIIFSSFWLMLKLCKKKKTSHYGHSSNMWRVVSCIFHLLGGLIDDVTHVASQVRTTSLLYFAGQSFFMLQTPFSSFYFIFY